MGVSIKAGGVFLAMPAPGGAAGACVPGVLSAGVRGSLCRQLSDQSAEHRPGPGGGRRREMKRSKVPRVRTRELERIRRQLGKGGEEGREQQRSAERNVLMGRQPEGRPRPPPPSQGCLKAPDLSKPFNWRFKKLPCSLTRRGLRFMPKMTQFPLSPP